MDGWMDGWIDGWMDGWIGWLDGWMDELVGWLMIDRRLCPRQCIIVHWNSQKKVTIDIFW